MKNFIIFFTEKEGSSPIIETLMKFDKIDIIGFEPFDTYVFTEKEFGGLGKDIKKEDLAECLDLIYKNDHDPDYYQKLINIYSKYNAEIKLNNFNKLENSIGLKIRLRNNELIFDKLKKYHVVTFVLIRQNVLRWALSKYVNKHLQFEFDRDGDKNNDIKMRFDCRRLQIHIQECEEALKDKKTLLTELKKYGIEFYPLYYEEFCHNKLDYFQNLLEKLDIKYSREAIEMTINQELLFKKAHSDNIREFAINYDEVYKTFRKYF